MTVFINGVPTEVPKGLIDLKPMFGQDVILVHSSGVPLPTNEFGILLQSLQPGESYFLVSTFVIMRLILLLISVWKNQCVEIIFLLYVCI